MRDTTASSEVTFGSAGLAELFERLVANGREIYGPTVIDGAIQLARVTSIDDLPTGWTDDQAPGRYEMHRRDDSARFGYAVGPSSAKHQLHPPRSPVWTMHRSPSGELEVTMAEPEPRRLAYFGVRPCEVAAIHKQDRVLDGAINGDAGYRARRSDSVMIVVNCGEPASTCFCTSMGTGPFANGGVEADIVVTELVGADTRYVASSGTPIGEALLAGVTTETVTPDEQLAVGEVRRRAEERITRRLPTEQLEERLYAELESERWTDVGERCLSCGNCTFVCPTCFCTNPIDTTDLPNNVSVRERVWDTCFSATFSQLGSRPERESTASRYRQWATHKLASWFDQFGESGCVGCGRCITWCPVGIDLTAEVNALIDQGTDTQRGHS